MSEQYFLVRKLVLGKEVVSLSLVVTNGMVWYGIVEFNVPLDTRHSIGHFGDD